jgi:RNA polymerase sigma factor (sigma-70 family)
MAALHDKHGEIDVPVALARWRTRELGVARRFRECGGASLAEIEEIYDATVTALVQRDGSYSSAEHLRGALHAGIKLRALRLHRDRGRRSRALERAAGEIHATGDEHAWREQPERALLAHEDDLIIGEFIAELDPLERRVFALVAEGRSWRAIATLLGLPETEARSATRACERKRQRFLTLYETGRLCGYRSRTIGSLLSGTQRSELALGQALAHLRYCRACRAEHQTSDTRLREAFDQRVLSVLPAPVLLAGHSPLVEQAQGLLERGLRVLHRASGTPSGGRERVFEAVAGTGAAGKIAAGVIGVAVLAGGAVGVTRAVEHGHTRHSHRAGLVAPTTMSPTIATVAPISTRTGRRRHGKQPAALRGLHQRVPVGFAYLGAPGRPGTPTVPTAPARTKAPVVTQRGGGPFGP